jgi:hypothetical protein
LAVEGGGGALGAPEEYSVPTLVLAGPPGPAVPAGGGGEMGAPTFFAGLTLETSFKSLSNSSSSGVLTFLTQPAEAIESTNHRESVQGLRVFAPTSKGIVERVTCLTYST